MITSIIFKARRKLWREFSCSSSATNISDEHQRWTSAMITTQNVLDYVYPKHTYNGTVAINNAHHNIVMSLILLLWHTKEERDGSSLVFTTPHSRTHSLSLFTVWIWWTWVVLKLLVNLPAYSCQDWFCTTIIVISQTNLVY